MPMTKILNPGPAGCSGCGCNECECEGERGKRGKRGRTGPTGPTGPAGITDVLPFAASWRVQWNGGSPIVTVKDIVAPPGIFIGLSPLRARAECVIYVLGGALARGALTVSIGVPALAFQNELLATMLQGFNQGGSWVVAVDAAGITGPSPAQVAAASPALPPVVPGQPILTAIVRVRYQSNGTTNDTALLLEDVTMSFSGSVGL